MKHLRRYNESVNQINWDLIEDAKDIALEYVDEYCVFNYFIISLDGKKIFQGGELTQNGHRSQSYREYNGESVKYKIMVCSKPYDVNLGTNDQPNVAKFNDKLVKETNDVVGRLRSMYPDEVIVGLDNIKENYTYNGINYKYDWAMPKSPVRIEVNNELNDILLEAKDLGYGVGTGWVEAPYAWIGVKLKDRLVGEVTSKKRRDIFFEQVSDTVERIKDYLTSKGFKTREVNLKSQIYIYFSYETP